MISHSAQVEGGVASVGEVPWDGFEALRIRLRVRGERPAVLRPAAREHEAVWRALLGKGRARPDMDEGKKLDAVRRSRPQPEMLRGR